MRGRNSRLGRRREVNVPGVCTCAEVPVSDVTCTDALCAGSDCVVQMLEGGKPLMSHARNGVPCKFDPLWYPELIRMTEESLDIIGFGPKTIQVCATQIYSEKFP